MKKYNLNSTNYCPNNGVHLDLNLMLVAAYASTCWLLKGSRMRILIIQLSVLLIFSVSCNKESKFDFKKMETSEGPITSPSNAPDKWLLAHIDVETTGLLSGYHEMIDIGIVMTNLKGDILDSLYLRIQPQYPERLYEKAFEVNAFNPESWKKFGALSAIVAVDSIISFHKKPQEKNMF